MSRMILLLVTLSFGSPAFAKECVQGQSDNWWQGEAAIMGTLIQVELRHTDGAAACSAIAAVMAEMRRIDSVMSPYRKDSVLSHLNQAGAYRATFVGLELFELIEESLKFSELTKGAFDVTYASVGQHYDYRGGAKPDAEQIETLSSAINYKHLVLNKTMRTVRFLNPGVAVDLGGIAKGYAVDQGIRILQEHGVTQAMVGAGGDSRILGDRDGEPWVVGIRDPRDEAGTVAMLPLMDVSVSTSGDYERYFEEDGVRYHHIIDPTTGDSARAVRSVTILGDRATVTDALSTSVFVLGVHAGLDLVNQMQGVDAVIIDGEGRMHFSQSLLELAAN